MSELGQRIAVQARSWLGTRFHHQGRLKKRGGQPGGVDCLGLLMGVGQELELMVSIKEGGRIPLKTLDNLHYGHLPDTQRLGDMLRRYLTPVPLTEARPEMWRY